jgi:hypothetical protein
VKNLLARFSRGHRPDIEAISAYADGSLAAAEAARLEQHIASCEACARQLEETRRVTSMLTAMGQAPLPRSFRLRQADVQAPAAEPAGFGVRARAFAPAISMAAVVLFGAVLAADLGTRGDGGESGMFASRSDSSEALTMADDAATENYEAPSGSGEAADGDSTSPAAGAIAPESATRAAPPAADSAAGAESGGEASAATSLAPAPAPVETQREADTQILSASSDDDAGARPGYLVAEVALAAIAIGAVGWLIYSRRKREVA